MGSISRYIFRSTFGAFLLILLTLTALIWVTQALRDFDLMTSQGQTVLVFIGLTGLIIPLLIMIIAPLALVVAVAHTLNKLGADSELIVMNAAGMRPWALFKPFLAVTVVVSLLVGVIGAYFAPEGLRMLRRWLVEVRTDLLSNIVQPGRFISIERGLAFHISERRPNGVLVGLVLDDRRDEKERVTILAEQGEIVKNERGSFLVLEKGSFQRQEAKRRDPSIVTFDRHAFDLSQFSGGPTVVQYSVREQYFWELLWPNPKDPLYVSQSGQFRAEFHDRIMAVLYPFAFVLLAYAYLGAPRTTRESRTWSMLAVVGGIASLRMFGFACTVFGLYEPALLFAQYAFLGATVLVNSYIISRGVIVEPPDALRNASNWVIERLARLTGTRLEPAR